LTILIKPSLKCNMNCAYCYELPIRQAEKGFEWNLVNVLKRIDDVMAQKRHDTPTLHGGEPLTLPRNELEIFFKTMYEKNGYGGIQTNGTLIDDELIEMFKKYKVSVGVSIDGPWPLNRFRYNEEVTNKVIKNIYRMRAEQISVSIIAVISRANGLPEQRQALKDFLLEIKGIGVHSGRLNLCKANTPELASKFELTTEEAIDFYKDMGAFVFDNGLDFQPFRDIVDNLLGLGTGTCVYTKCDYWSTASAVVILGDGSLTSCLKTAIDGQPFVRDTKETYERYEILKSIPKEEGGCGGCRYWRICFGHCPSEAKDGDWRNKSRYCDVYYSQYEFIENRLKGMLPNLKTVPDFPCDDEHQDYLDRRSRNWKHDPFALMRSTTANCASANRKSARMKQEQPSECKSSQMKQGDGWRHGDSPHGDHKNHADDWR
jgi:uncharacterized protein